MRKYFASRESKAVCLVVLLAALCLPLFYQIGTIQYSDNIPHARFVRWGIEEGRWPQHFLYHGIVSVAALGRSHLNVLEWATIFVLTYLVLLKAVLSYSIISREICNDTLAFWAVLGLVFASPIANWWNFPHIYLGQISANVWHNPTTILAMPLAVWLFYSACRSLDSLKPGYLCFVSALLVINVYAKPNYTLAFLPVMIPVYLYSFWKRKTGFLRSFVGMLILFLPVAFALASQFFVKYAEASPAVSGIAFAPFQYWRERTPTIAGSIAVSVAFPAVFTALYWKEALRDRRIVYAWFVLAMAVFYYAAFNETGMRSSHGNFAWGHHIAMFVLFLACASVFYRQKFWEFRHSVVLVLWGLHAATGFVFFGRQLIHRGYW